ncbi:MAG: AAA family ATPase [Tannerellaceae bacterium]
MATKGIPYGLSDYVTLNRDNCYYVDKTRFIPMIERAARFFFLIRPRRFGKSLMISVLESYYDINNADRFEELFGERWIYTHPTELRAKFMVLKFNFSQVNPAPDKLLPSFETHCKMQFIQFLDKYEYLFKPGFREEVMQCTTADARLSYINMKAKGLGLRLYLIIDEYDNFTNTILSTYGTDAYRQATHGEGFFRFFFNVIKGATTDSGAALERMFITGVSPVTLDDVTSGFNIGANFSSDADFNNIIGFSEAELRTMLEYYNKEGKLVDSVDTLINTMKPWYDNYCFAKRSLGESMYNSDMVLYFLNNYIRTGYAPEMMVDNNIRTDYNKIRHLIRLDKNLGANFSVVREIIETGRTVTERINDSFPAEAMVKPDNFKSLLYYFGLLTINGSERGKVVLSIPNQTVREQLFNYLIESYEQAEIFSIDLSHLSDLMGGMAYDGNWQPLFAYIAAELKTQSRIREFIEGEAHVKGFLLAYLGLSNYYYLQPEYESGKGYADFYFQPNPTLTDISYAYLLEVKYAKADDPESRIATLKAEAAEQLLKYANDPIVTTTIGAAKLRLITVVFRTWEVVAMEEVEIEQFTV